jgi:hypothetical protein
VNVRGQSRKYLVDGLLDGTDLRHWVSPAEYPKSRLRGEYCTLTENNAEIKFRYTPVALNHIALMAPLFTCRLKIRFFYIFEAMASENETADRQLDH